MKRRNDLTTPRQRRRVGIHYDTDAFGQFSEAIARFLGTARYLVIQSIIVIVWVVVNVLNIAPFDDYPFIFLTLILSLQASYAAPLILLAQNRQEDREREQVERDREMAMRTQADTEYLARELAGVRLALADIVTTADLRDHLEAINEALEKLVAIQENESQAPRHDS
ncbi:unannotated protein [freshwater metagenome]|jgi:uncharacterized membrane protein|uniref:Unannotated protein n=1 Tax=freshwater metagenome TaxID=449393 RepID=A0A6J6LVM7_9ZZZZ|nr:DUF1003 domain-containing protein [Actinomycetota bacterium]MSZ32094.1 DUF1003 domain-containing protein [Actinomycetota bacterium]